jgi:hypothetical protein
MKYDDREKRRGQGLPAYNLVAMFTDSAWFTPIKL